MLSATTLAFPVCTRFITKHLQTGVSLETPSFLYQIGAVMLVLLAIHVACRLFVDYQGHVMGAKMESDMRRELFEHYQKLSFSFYDEKKTGQLMTRLSGDTYALSELYHHGPEDIIISFFNFIGAFLILLSINIKLAIIVFMFLPIMGVYAYYFNKKMNLALRKGRDRIEDINAQAEDSLAGIRVVQSFTNSRMEHQKFALQNERFLDSRKDVYRNEAYFFAGMSGFTRLMSLAVVVFGGVYIVQESLDLADMMTFLLFVGILIEPIDKFSNFARLYQEGITGFDRFMEALEARPDIQDNADAIELGQAQGNIEFRKVSFKYKKEHDYVLSDISFNIKSGEYLALVGSSGVGKTTLCSLIPRFYEIDAGEILLDGFDIRNIRLRSLRQNIGVVQQDVYLFAGTIADNIRYGKLDASSEEVVEAAKKALAHDFISSLPKGYDTDIGQRGVKLSGGQKQRLSIARVFLKNPPILIFDEATSALDNESEQAVQASLERLAEQRTTLVVAHRLSTVRRAHRIIVLTEQGIGEQGSHDELLAKDGLYAKMYNSTSLKLITDTAAGSKSLRLSQQ